MTQIKIGDEVWRWSQYNFGKPPYRVGVGERYTVLYLSEDYAIVKWESSAQPGGARRSGSSESVYDRVDFDEVFTLPQEIFEVGKTYRLKKDQWAWNGSPAYTVVHVQQDPEYPAGVALAQYMNGIGKRKYGVLGGNIPRSEFEEVTE